jgi:DUF4097 and DUF4098 domain-containing protein YvlB
MSSVIRALLFLPLLLLSLVLARGEDGLVTTAELRGEIAADAEIKIDNVNGLIVLRAGDSDRYEIAITKKSRFPENLDLIEVHHEIDHDSINIEVHIPKKKGWFSFSNVQGSVDLVITLPATVELDDISTVNGTVEINGFVNETEVSSVNGRIIARDLAGSADLKTVNGTINATFADVGDNDELSFESVNGAISLSFPVSLNADLRTSVVNGRTTCDFPITLDDDSSAKKLRGRIGEGGASVEVATVNGSISLRQL